MSGPWNESNPARHVTAIPIWGDYWKTDGRRNFCGTQTQGGAHFISLALGYYLSPFQGFLFGFAKNS
jgi:hypothetical protein